MGAGWWIAGGLALWWGTTPPPALLEWKAPRLEGALQLNGTREERAWASAAPAAAGPLHMWALWTKSSLFLAFESKEIRVEDLKANGTARDEAAVAEDDVVEWYFKDPSAPTSRICRWAVNVRGVTASARNGDWSWPLAFKAAVVNDRLKRRWTGELEVPWASLGVADPSAAPHYVVIRRTGPKASPQAASPWLKLVCEAGPAMGGRLAGIDDVAASRSWEDLAAMLDSIVLLFHGLTGAYPPDDLEWSVVWRGVWRQARMSLSGDPDGSAQREPFPDEWTSVWKALPGVKITLTYPPGTRIAALQLPREEDLPRYDRFLYRRHPKGYELIYPGPDGVEGTEDDVRSNGSWLRPHEDPEWFGVRTAPAPGGVKLVWVAPRSPAALAGLAVGDVVSVLEGSSVRSPMAFADILGRYERGSTVVVEGSRRGEAFQKKVLLGR